MLGNWVRAPAKRWIDGKGYRIDIWGIQTLPAEAEEENWLRRTGSDDPGPGLAVLHQPSLLTF